MDRSPGEKSAIDREVKEGESVDAGASAETEPDESDDEPDAPVSHPDRPARHRADVRKFPFDG